MIDLGYLENNIQSSGARVKGVRGKLVGYEIEETGNYQIMQGPAGPGKKCGA